MKYILLAHIFLVCSAGYGASTPWETNPQGSVRLIAPYRVAPEKGTLYFGMNFKPKPGWMVYWKQSGEAGYPPKFDFKGSRGFENPQILWPRPKLFILPGDIREYGYEQEVVYPIKARAVASGKKLHIEAKIDYLTCKESCIPYKYTLILDIPQGAAPQSDPEIEPLLQTFLGQIPTESDEAIVASLQPAPAAKATSALGWMLWLGFVGGLILNIMPCVLPILSIKLLGLLQQSGQARWLIVRNALASAAGILVSFEALAVTAVLARQAGAAFGWGIQFQNPWFVAFLTVVVLLFALNLWGFFEINLPGVFGRFATSFGQSETFGAYFVSGLFATLLATPCSAPFLGSAMGFALAQPASSVLAVFGAAGTGMAFPYLLLAVFPGSLHWLPKPGVWMLRLRTFFGFLLAGTALWLGWVFVQQVTPAQKVTTRSGPIEWVPFREDEIPRIVASGRPVFVDVTADWCLTCKVNERLVIQDPEVVAEFKKRDVVMMRADWTQQDAAIGRYLKRYGRAGIPFYALYYPYQDPVLLSELLTKKQVLSKLRAWDALH